MADFTFKQFQIKQQNCAMKVGTDGVLLGAWAPLDNVQHILDMGTGTGLLALMAAQRAPQATISAVELDAAACHQAEQNVAASPWSERIELYHADVGAFCRQTTQTFDLIVANPPYFPVGVACASPSRAQARYLQESHWTWLNWAGCCLAEQGRVAMVLPMEAGQQLIAQTQNEPDAAWHCIRQTQVITKAGKMPQRVLLLFARYARPCVSDSLTVYDENNRYTEGFIALTRDFYLAF